MRNKISIVFVFLFYTLGSIAQTTTGDAAAYNNKLKNLLNNQITEKAYLHFDKPYYATGDTIYFKAYVTLGGQHLPSKLSGILHVDLINTINTIDRSLKLQIVNGVAKGDFALADSLLPGIYRVRAYTQWMRNLSDDGFFEKAIPVGSSKTPLPKLNVSIPKGAPADIKFFPEGGDLLEGVKSKIAFKAIDPNGAGINAKGSIVDGDNNEVGRFTSSHLGMGVFDLLPLAGKTYSAKVTYADGSRATVALPQAKTNGIVLQADNDSLAKISLSVSANNAYFNQHRNQGLSIKIVSGGVTTAFKATLSYPTMRFDIQKKNLHSGIAQITLYAATGEPLSERLVFVQRPDLLDIGVSGDKALYQPREKVNLSISVKNKADQPIAGNFSLSVTDESKVPVDENDERTILSELLLTSDLKGYVEQPNYYFINNDAERVANLDILLLTQGYRKYVWKPQADSLAKYPPEGQLQIAGTLKSNSGKQPITNGKVSLMSPEGGPVLSQTSGPQGEFTFPGLMFTGSTNFIINGTTAKGDNNVKISIDKEVQVPVTTTVASLSSTPGGKADAMMETYLANKKNEQEDIRKYGSAGGIMLKEVKVNGKKLKTEPEYRTQSFAGAGHADQLIFMKDVKGAGELSTLLSGRLRGVRFDGKGAPFLQMNNVLGGSRPMLIIVDGARVLPNRDGVSINNISYTDVETVEVLQYASASMYGMEGAGGVMIITTKQGVGVELADVESKGVFPVVVNGFYKAREFYAPKYANDAIKKPNADLRTTVFWQPELTTDSNGSALLNFYNADGKGNYRVVIEGIDDKGNIGRRVYRYKVN